MQIVWLIAAALCLTLGAAAIALFGGRTTPRQGVRTALHALVPLIAAAAYALSAWGFARGDVDGPDAWFTFRYLAWSLTTTLLLTGLAITATPAGGTRHYGMVAALLVANLAMVGSGAVAEASEGATAALWFVVALVFFAVVLCILWLSLRDSARSGHPIRAELFVRHAGLLTVLWSLYAVVFLAGPNLFGLFGATTLLALFAILDVAAKAGYGLLVVLEDERLAAVEPAEAGWPADTARPFPSTPASQAPANSSRTDAVARATTAPVRPQREGRTLVVGPQLWRDARDRLLAQHYGERLAPSARRTASALRAGGTRVLSAGSRAIDRMERPRRFVVKAGDQVLFIVKGRPKRLTREVAPPPPAPLRKRRPRLPRPSTPFGRLETSDAVPVAIVGAVLLAITLPSRDGNDGNDGS